MASIGGADMAERTCDQCGKAVSPDGKGPHQARRFCDRSCWKAWREIHAVRCSVDGCTRALASRGMCQKHYHRWIRTGGESTDSHAATMTKVCGVATCGRVTRSLSGYCKAHRQRLRKFGDVRADIPLRPRGKVGGGTIDQGGYRLVRGVREHRTVMEQVLGRPLVKGETVHHLNGDKLDNRPENLELWVSGHRSGQRVTDRVADALEILERYAPEHLAQQPTPLRLVA